MTTFSNSNSWSFNFIFENNSSYGVTVNLDPILSQLSYGGQSGYTYFNSTIGASMVGYNVPITLPAGTTGTWSGSSPGGEIQYGSASLFTVNNATVNFWFWSGSGDQYINLLADNGFSVSVNTSIQNNLTGNGVDIGLGGCGGSLNTQNVCIQIANVEDNFFANFIIPPIPEPGGVGLLALGLALLTRARRGCRKI